MGYLMFDAQQINTPIFVVINGLIEGLNPNGTVDLLLQYLVGGVYDVHGNLIANLHIMTLGPQVIGTGSGIAINFDTGTVQIKDNTNLGLQLDGLGNTVIDQKLTVTGLFVVGTGIVDASGTGVTFNGTGQATFAAIPNTPVKIYRALISQTGGNPPTATVLENSLGAVPVWNYNSTGNYSMTLTNAFPVAKTFMFIQPVYASSIAISSNNDGNAIRVLTGSSIGVPANTLITNISIEILVYP